MNDIANRIQNCNAALQFYLGGIIYYWSKKVNEDMEALFYAQKIIENGWTRDLLLNHLKAGTYHHEITA